LEHRLGAGFGHRVDRTYGGIPPDALSWLHDRLPPYFDRAASDYVAHLALRAGEAMVDRVRARMRRVTAALRRDLEIELAPVEFSARLNAIAAGNLPSTASATRDVDAFISHASEDKSEVARPLAAALVERELTVWLDEMELVVGRSLYRTIEDGLRRCRFGVVILSPSFFSKDWPRRELSALAALSDAEGRDKILPVWHKVDFAAVARASPLLADVYAAKTADGLAHVADAISVAIARGVKTL
jgi:TIR domain